MSRTFFILSCIAAAAMALLAMLAQSHVELLYDSGVSGIFVPDAVGLKDTTLEFWQPDGAASYPWHLWRTLLGVIMLYSPTVLLGAAGAAVVNASLMALSAFLFFKTMASFAMGSKELRALPAVATLALLLVAANIYLIEVAMFPNKEIPLIALTNLFMYVLLARRNSAAALAVAAVTFFFRDGYGLILGLSAGMVIVARHMPPKWDSRLLVLLALALAIVPVSYLAGLDHAFARNAALASVVDSRFAVLLESPIGFFAKVLGNAINLGMRPQIFDEAGGVFLLHVGYWQFGVCILAGLAWAVVTMASKTKESGVERELAMVVLVVLLGISYSSYGQPRYLMPLIFWLTMPFVRYSLYRRAALGACIIGPLLFFALGLLPVEAVPQTAVTWSWL